MSRRTPEALARYQEVYDLVVNQGIKPIDVAAMVGLTRARVSTILIREFGIYPQNLRLEREARQREIKALAVLRPRICPVCGEDFRVEGWIPHLLRAKHNMVERSAFFIERDKLIAADYAAGMRHRDIEAKYHVAAPSIMLAIRRMGVPLRRPRTARNGTMLESRALKAIILELVDAGVPFTQIAERVHCSTTYVSLVRAKYRGRPDPDAVLKDSRARMNARWDAWRRGEGPRPNARRGA